jgi:hypothetical protein
VLVKKVRGRVGVTMFKIGACRVNKFGNISCGLFLAVCLLLCSGCDLVGNSVVDLRGWDVTACEGNFFVCAELIWDNSDMFDGGFVEAVGGLN